MLTNLDSDRIKNLVFKNFILINHNAVKSFEIQYNASTNAFDDWKKQKSQIDDVLLIGIKF